jgi:hypothetical protein
MSEYHGEWNCASNSRLSRLMRSPAHLKAYIEQDHEDTPALALGRAIHMAILEPDLFADTYTVADQCVAVTGKGARCTNGGTWPIKGGGFVCGVHAKTAAKNEVEIDQDTEVLSASDHAVCMGVRDSVRSLHAAGGLLESVQEVELSVVWDDAETGVRCKARWDGCARLVAGGTIIDIKTTRDASRMAFERSVFTYGYHRQGALYLQSAEAVEVPARHYAILAVEKEPPYAAAVYRLTEGAIDAGGEQIRPLMRRYAECLRTDEWPGYPDEVVDIALPHYAWRQIDDELAELEGAA